MTPENLLTAIMNQTCNLDLSNIINTFFPHKIFYCFESLVTITLSNNLEFLQNFCFYKCKSLETVKMDNSTKITSLSIGCFARCTSLKSIKLPQF